MTIRSRNVRLLSAFLLIALGILASVSPAGADAAPTAPADADAAGRIIQLGPPPTMIYNTWLGAFHMNDHVFRTGDKVVATAKVSVEECFIPGQCVSAVSWSGLPFAPKKPCPGSTPGTVPSGTPTLKCKGRAGAPTGGWVTATVDFANPTGSSAIDTYYYAVLPDDQSVIEGHIANRDGGGVAGVEVRAYKGAKLAYTTTTGADGYYMMQVKPGKYEVVPRGGPTGKKKPRYKPAFKDVNVPKGKTAHASFTLEAGLEVSVSFSTRTTPADGQHVITGRVTVREYGKPKPNATVQLEAMPTLPPRQAVLRAPRVTMCTPASGRVWPTGTLQAPNGSAVNVTTDDKGKYDFSLTIGTMPGRWTLRAWGLNAIGGLSLEEDDASDEASVTLTRIGGATTDNFVTALATLGLSGKLPSAGGHTGLRDDLVKAIDNSSFIGGLTFNEVGGPGGTGALLISPATRPPVADSSSVLHAPGSLVIGYGAWTGTGLPGSVTDAANLGSVIQRGLLQHIPTFSQWSSGASVIGWNSGAMGDVVAPWTDFSSYGWAYRGVVGGCY